MRIRTQTRLLPLGLLLLGNLALSQCKLQPQSASTIETGARLITTLEKFKHNADGSLKVQTAEIEFRSGHRSATISISSIEDVIVGAETTESGGTVGEVAEGASMAAPYDSGAILPILLREKVDVLTITFRDSDAGLHAAIFAVPISHGMELRTALIAHGAHAASHDSPAASNRPGSTPSDTASVSPAASPAAAPAGDHSEAPAIRIEPPDPGDVRIPAEFRMAIYENLLDKLAKSGIFSTVYRSGDHRADNIEGLLTLRTTIDRFKQGNQMERRLTSILGTTKIKVHAQVLDRKSETVQAVLVEGKVRIFGENLGATSDVAKQITKALRKHSFH